ncbi:MAG TPA: hypothetical protein VI078_16605 [bacterium]
MRLDKFAACVLLLALLSASVGCGRGYSEGSTRIRLYEIDRPYSAGVGAPMISEVDKFTYFYKDGTKPYVTDEVTGSDELIYTGRSGSVITLTYREFTGESSGELARPAFFQTLTYDLASSPIIGFKKHKIKVLDANNEMIKFVVVSD